MRTLISIALAVAAIACAPQDVVVAHTDDPIDSGGGGADARPDGPPPCFSESDCQHRFFCKKDSCDQAAPGACAQRREICPGDFHPVCGCSGTTYWNECYGDQNGDNVRLDAECPDGVARTCDGRPSDCNVPHSFCSPLGMVEATCPPSEVTGKCWFVPFNCNGTTNDGTRWNPCPPAKPCVNTCTAIQNGIAYSQDQGQCPP